MAKIVDIDCMGVKIAEMKIMDGTYGIILPNGDFYGGFETESAALDWFANELGTRGK